MATVPTAPIQPPGGWNADVEIPNMVDNASTNLPSPLRPRIEALMEDEGVPDEEGESET